MTQKLANRRFVKVVSDTKCDGGDHAVPTVLNWHDRSSSSRVWLLSSLTYICTLSSVVFPSLNHQYGKATAPDMAHFFQDPDFHDFHGANDADLVCISDDETEISRSLRRRPRHIPLHVSPAVCSPTIPALFQLVV